MIRTLALLVAAVAFLAGTGPSRAQGVDMRDIMGGGPGFFERGGAGPVPRETVYNPTNYAPGTIFINTAERRLYLILPNGQALRYGGATCRATWPAASKTRSAPARSIWARRSIAFTAPTSRRRSDRRCRPAASA